MPKTLARLAVLAGILAGSAASTLAQTISPSASTPGRTWIAGAGLAGYWDDETFLGRGPTASFGVAYPIGRHLQTELELLVGYHHRVSGAIEASGKPITGHLRLLVLTAAPARRVRPFIGAGGYLTHHSGEFAGPGLPEGGSGRPLPWHLTALGVEASVGLQVRGSARAWWRPAVHFGFTVPGMGEGGHMVTTPIVTFRGSLTIGWL